MWLLRFTTSSAIFPIDTRPSCIGRVHERVFILAVGGGLNGLLIYRADESATYFNRVGGAVGVRDKRGKISINFFFYKLSTS